MRHSSPREFDDVSPDELDFLADISTEWEQERNRRRELAASAERNRALQRFVDDLTMPDCRLRGRDSLSEGTRQFVRAITDNRESTIDEAVFDPGKHPRVGGPPNPGWFARTGTRGNNRVNTRIALASGKNWSGDRVLDAMRVVAPGWMPFVERMVTLARTSSGENNAETIVRVGENGPDVRTVEGGIDASRDVTVHFHIPDDWNDAQVVQYILNQMADHMDVNRLASEFAEINGKHDLLHELIQKRFQNGLPRMAALAKGYYSALAGLAPGGGVAVAAWDIEHGDYLGAALGAAFMLPLGKLAKAGAEAGGTIAIRAGEKVIALLPIKVIQRIQKLAPEQQALLQKRLLAATSLDEAGKIVHEFLQTPFDRHHPLAKFLGGHFDQTLIKIPREIHKEFHAELLKELRAAGFTLPIGSKSGSTEKWLAHFADNKGAQAKAFDAVLKVSGMIDERHGTNLKDFVIKNLANSEFSYYP